MKKTSRDRIVRGTGNVLADLGLADADELSTKIQLAVQLNRIVEKRHLKQRDTSALLGITQGNVSLLANYKLDGFSIERLMTLLNALDRDVEIRVRKKPRSRAQAQTMVVTG